MQKLCRQIHKIAVTVQKKEKFGVVWEGMHDYLISVGNDKALNDLHLKETADHLKAYLINFGMARAYKGGIKSWKAEKTLKNARHEIKAYMRDSSNENYRKAWDKLFFILPKNFKRSSTMISKILMGLGGQHPALDSRFMFTMKNHPAIVCIGVDKIRESFEEMVAKKHLKPLTTQAGNMIPWPRVIDMVFWRIGRKDEYSKMDWLEVS